MQYLLLSAAIVAEVVGTLSLKASAGFTRMSPSLLVAAGYATAFVLLAQVLKLGMPIGTALQSGLPSASRWSPSPAISFSMRR